MKISNLTKFALTIAVCPITLFSSQSTAAAERNFNSMSNQEIVNIPTEELASLNFEDLIAISNLFNYPTQNELSINLNSENIDLPIEVLADLKFETLMALTDVIDVTDSNIEKEDNNTITWPISAVAEIELSALIDLTNTFRIQECELSSTKLTKEDILALPTDRLATMNFEDLISIL